MSKRMIGYLGPNGSFSEMVANGLKTNSLLSSFEFKMIPNLLALISAIELGTITIAVFPIRNSKSGLLHAPDGSIFLERIANPASNLKWIGEKLLPLQFCLVGASSSAKTSITRIHTNEYGAALCSDFLSLFPSWKLIRHPSSSAAAEEVARINNLTDAALASREAALKLSLTILDDTIMKCGEEPIMHFVFLAKTDFQLIDNVPSIPQVSSHLFSASTEIEIIEEIKKSEIEFYTIYPVANSTLLVDFVGKVPNEALPSNLTTLWRHYFGTYPVDLSSSRLFPGNIRPAHVSRGLEPLN